MLCDAARGVLYLHCLRPPVVHRDLKVSSADGEEGNKEKVYVLGLTFSSHRVCRVLSLRLLATNTPSSLIALSLIRSRVVAIVVRLTQFTAAQSARRLGLARQSAARF
jgi:hypothetical protein